MVHNLLLPSGHKYDFRIGFVEELGNQVYFDVKALTQLFDSMKNGTMTLFRELQMTQRVKIKIHLK